ncbi:hypothetical protein C0Q70_00658 [Pomacea canaliculata]|uniref:Sushi domain-containing protein n=1 Tax=Pomacea canaliculata TaxID=400727 RepID=A0A2T7PXB8_POMCA|nr:hypothetical protein C0Q70_00658 [Pomacea canaliculata]
MTTSTLSSLLVGLLVVVVAVVMASVIPVEKSAVRETRAADCYVDGRSIPDGHNFTRFMMGPCIEFKCNAGEIFPLKSGCYRNGQCYPIGDKYSLGCLERKCTTINIWADYRLTKEGYAPSPDTNSKDILGKWLVYYRMDLVMGGCPLKGECLEIGQSKTKDCTTMTCQREVIAGIHYLSIKPTKIRKPFLSETLHGMRVRDNCRGVIKQFCVYTFIQGEGTGLCALLSPCTGSAASPLTMTTSTSSSLLVGLLVVAVAVVMASAIPVQDAIGGCFKDGECHPLGDRYTQSCIEQVCVSTKDSTFYKIAKEGCLAKDNTCVDVNSRWTSGCNTYLCSRTLFSRSMYSYRLEVASWGCQLDDECVPENHIITEGCHVKQCQKRESLIGFRTLRMGCPFQGECLAVGELKTKDCTTLTCDREDNKGLHYLTIRTTKLRKRFLSNKLYRMRVRGQPPPRFLRSSSSRAD